MTVRKKLDESYIKDIADRIKTFIGHEISLKYTKDAGTHIFYATAAINSYNCTVCVFKLVQLPGCCGVMVSHSAMVGNDFRRKGLGTLLNNIRKEIAYNLGYNMLICTDIIQNVAQRKLLAKNGWTDAFKFINWRTGNEVALSYINLEKFND